MFTFWTIWNLTLTGYGHVLLPGLSTPVWMTLSMVKPLGVQCWRRRLYISGVRTLAMWLWWCSRSGYSSSADCCLLNLASLALLNKYNNTWGVKIPHSADKLSSHLSWSESVNTICLTKYLVLPKKDRMLSGHDLFLGQVVDMVLYRRQL